MRIPDNATYNATFTYPEGGAIEYVKAIASELPQSAIALEEPLTGLDLTRRIARTPRREIRFDRLISSAPFPALLRIAGLSHDQKVFTWNKVLVFNLGFDRKGPRGVHWIYYPDRSRAFYRVGFYDNIFDSDRMSLYVEVGYAPDVPVDQDTALGRVLDDLRAEGVIADHRLVDHHSVVMDPAYVHITGASMAEHARLKGLLNTAGVYPIGRYGGWTYCSIEDNIVEAQGLVASFAADDASSGDPHPVT
jgi:protoporphyrinogen oxidase